MNEAIAPEHHTFYVGVVEFEDGGWTRTAPVVSMEAAGATLAEIMSVNEAAGRVIHCAGVYERIETVTYKEV